MAALFFDVDGTLIDSYHGSRAITPAVLGELARVQSLGHRIFLSSGRPRLLMTQDLLAPGFDGLVLLNGGYVEMGGESVFEERMGADLARRTFEFLDELGAESLIACAEHLYTRRENRGIREFFSSGRQREIFTFDFVLEEALTEAIKMEAVIAAEDRARVTEEALVVLGPQISCDGHGGEGTFELYPTAISKARGIEVVLEHLGMDAQDAFAFGDGTNDIEMLRFCGCGVAMGNSEPEALDAADIACPPVWEDGLAQVLHELF